MMLDKSSVHINFKIEIVELQVLSQGLAVDFTFA